MNVCFCHVEIHGAGAAVVVIVVNALLLFAFRSFFFQPLLLTFVLLFRVCMCVRFEVVFSTIVRHPDSFFFIVPCFYCYCRCGCAVVSWFVAIFIRCFLYRSNGTSDSVSFFFFLKSRFYHCTREFLFELFEQYTVACLRFFGELFGCTSLVAYL